MRKTIGGLIIIIGIVGVASWLLWSGENGSVSPKNEGIAEVIFQCEAGKSVEATFRQKSVVVKLSDGRSMTLSQVRSGSGARYANQDESIVFWNKGSTAFLIENNEKTYVGCVEEGEGIHADLKTYKSKNNLFIIRYPPVFEVEQSGTDAGSAWSFSSAQKGHVGIKLVLSASYQPKTNFREAAFLVGWSNEEQAVEQCLEPPSGNIIKAEEIVIDGINYHHTKYNEAGAGNFYTVDQYRTLKKERCYSIEQMIHSTNLGNYSPEQDITAYDKKKVQQVLAQAWQGFQFL